ncbi:MAG: hypothetical protein Q8K32_33730 [Archangium sp.]|nr:hypothetical protein [Archangium sp.]
MIALVISLLAAAPIEARFVLEVGALPVAELRISVQGDRYFYDATHFLEEGPREHHVELALGKGPLPEVLALLRRPRPGCREVLEERSRTPETLCVEAAEGNEVTGTIAGEAFVARYDAEARLTGITVGSAHWAAAARPVSPPIESPFVRGVKVPAGELVLEPAVAGARWLTRTPVGTGEADSVGRVRCLVLARGESARQPGSMVSVGLVIEDGRAYPHAWVTAANGMASDPSVLPDDPVLATRRYLELPRAVSGGFFLRFFDGAVRLKAK